VPQITRSSSHLFANRRLDRGKETEHPMSYQVIARKWRPQRFAEIVGQGHVTETLANAIRANRVAHAYIFSGARGVGKTTAARILAKALNCVKGPTPEPCGECDSCKEIAAGTSLDVIEIDAASNRGIDQIRELREMVRYAPAAARSKVVILDEAHMLTEEASNALLKTLEEPPDKVIFVMATTEPESLADTIRSRAQHFHFRALSFPEIIGRLNEICGKEGLRAEPGALGVIARAAEGSLRDALSLLEQARAYCGDDISDRQVHELLGIVPEEELGELIAAIEAGSAERALALVHRFQTEGRNLQHFCREAIRHVRNLLVARVCGADSDLIAATAEQRPRLAAAAAKFTEEDLTRFFQILLETDDDLRRRPDPRLHLEIGILKLVNASRLAPLEELIAELKQGGPAPAPRLATSGSTNAPRASGASPASTEITAGAPRAGAAVPAAPPSVVARAAARFDGVDAAQVESIKSAIQAQQKFLGELVEHVTRWELDGAEVRLYFPVESRAFADLLQARDPMEKLRNITSKVLGRSLRVCVKLDSAATASVPAHSLPGTQELRAQFEQDPIVRAMLQRFGGQISEVKRRQED
jgi:DNA polymerase-3 subunit gamma/tau